MRWADSSSEQLKLNHAQILMKTFTLNRVQSVLQSFTKTDFRFSSYTTLVSTIMSSLFHSPKNKQKGYMQKLFLQNRRETFLVF